MFSPVIQKELKQVVKVLVFYQMNQKNKISETLKEGYKSGRIIPPMKDKHPIVTEEQKKQISETLIERYKNQEHHLKGIEPWNKGKKGSQKGWNKGLKLGPMSDEQKKQRSDTLKERYKTQEHPAKGKEPWIKGKKGSQVAWNKGVKLEQIECPHCGKLSDKSNAKRWHFDNCKHKK